jgi:hypothetical protein
MQKKILIFIDILGFENRAIEIENALKIPAKKIRKDFLDTINEKIIKLKEKKIIAHYSYGQRDDWILIVDSLDQAFQSVRDIFDHNVLYPNFEKIPLEVAIGTGKYDQWAKFDDISLISEDSTIQFLKTKIIGNYHIWYKKNNSNISPNDTFILLTESFFSLLNNFDKKTCQKITNNEDIFYSISYEKVIENALIVDFLIEIGHPKHTRYKMISDLFVPPFEYREMERTLENEKLLFIIGTQEYGKTFSAVRLLWEYFKKGYKPKWIRGGEDFERNICRTTLENVSEILAPKSIIYFEDPFGKITYEKRESLEREIGTIINEIKRINDVFIIITSREEVFKEFEQEMIPIGALNQLKLIFSIKNNSYDHPKRVKMLLNWATLFSCKWLNYPEIEAEIFNTIKDKTILPTPLSIWNFAISTINTTQRESILPILEEKSQETSLSFAKETEKMSYDKIIFLTYPFIADYGMQFVNNSYNDLILSKKISDAWKFEHLFKWFVNDKIELVNQAITFSHPSYWESFKTIMKNEKKVKNDPIINYILLVFSYLTEKGGTPAGGIAKFISYNFDIIPESSRNDLLRKLSENSHAARWVATTIIMNYNALPSDIQNRIFKLPTINKTKTVRLLSETIAENFYSLPQNVRNQLLIFLVTNDNAAPAIARILMEHFNEISQDLREQLLRKLSEKSKGATLVPEIIAENYGSISQDIRSLFFRLSENEKTSGYVAQSIVNNFEILPQSVRSLLYKLYKQPHSAGKVAESIVKNYEKLHENIKNILTLYAVDSNTAGIVAIAVIENYNHLPKKIRDLIFTFSKDDSIIGDLIEPIGNNYDNLPSEIRKILFDISDKPELVKRIAKTIGDNFEKISENDRNEFLLILATKHHSANTVAKILESHFNEIQPDTIIQLIQILCLDDYSAGVVAKILNEHFRDFSKNDIEKQLELLSEQDSSIKEVGEIIIKNYHYLSDNTKKILFKLTGNKKNAHKIAAVLTKYYSKLPENVALELLIKLAENEIAVQGVAIIISNNFNKIPEGKRNELLLTMSEIPSTAKLVPDIISRYYYQLPENVTNLLYKLAKNEETACNVATSISLNFSSLPNEIRDFLFPFAHENNSGYAIYKIIFKNFFQFPDEFRDKLLLILSENDIIAPQIAYILLKNFTRINSKMKALLFDLVKNKEIAIKIALAIMKNYDSMPKEIKNLLTSIMKESILRKLTI